MNDTTTAAPEGRGPDLHHDQASTLTVYFDGSCPLCRREIGFYRRQAHHDVIAWVDASAGDEELVAPDLTRDDALARFHVGLRDGRLESGAHGFAEMWTAIVGFCWLGKLALSPVAKPLLEAAYKGFLRLRPVVQRIATKFESEKGTG